MTYRLHDCTGLLVLTVFSLLQAREAGQALAQEVGSLAARLAAATAPSLQEAYRLSKEVGLLTDVRVLFPLLSLMY